MILIGGKSMDVEIMNTLSILIKREKITNNILFMLKGRVPELEETALEHGKHLYALIKLFSNTGFNIELEEPKYINLTREQVITMFLNDITVYSDLIKKSDPKIITILSELMKIKVSILNHLIFNEDMRQQSISKRELASYDGKNGRPAYVAVDNLVYDVTATLSWADGEHFGLTPGRDLSSEFLGCHGMNKEVLSKLPIVGELVQ
jgi:predicted heme/steroid binding protein